MLWRGFDTAPTDDYNQSPMAVTPYKMIGVCAMAAYSVFAAGAGPDLNNNWPQWRGPFANGVAPHANPPVVWSETNNIQWQIALPGKGHSSPVVFGGLVFVTAARSEEDTSEL